MMHTNVNVSVVCQHCILAAGVNSYNPKLCLSYYDKEKLEII